MKKCPYCGHDNEDKAEICAHCFAGMPEPKQEKPRESVKDPKKNKE